MSSTQKLLSTVFVGQLLPSLDMIVPLVSRYSTIRSRNNCLYCERWIPSLGALQQLGVFSIKTLSNFHY